ncbi:hypothetical protein [Myceligenerans salitolerans]|uniref:DUF4760 domain-containing protein n=1 Tax=Myceligenerans salitolerans TaxID=1230528 RepID=A0ABS3IDS9_9MICO|nr:hypothetical protein [Myceligenerans salitolerans]MBO0611108.1 hypothetical protein [Myceligenerans salitolerans]
MPESTSWQSAALAFVLVAIPAAISLWAAISSRRSAVESRASQDESARLQRLEARVSVQKYDVYSSIIVTLGKALAPGNKPEDLDINAIGKFQTWAVIYASDGALGAFGRFMQGTFANAPARVLLRLYSEFVIEARKDMGDETTQATPVDILAPRLKDLYTNKEMTAIFTLPFEELCLKENWSAPWDAND